MSSILYNIIISPIELVVEIIFEIMFRLVGQRQTNQGLAVIGVSITISLLTLPLYRRADAVQQKERDLQKKLAYWTNHIKKTFKGDERFMMQQAYYRENGYSPLMALNGSITLLLEIPFFIAAYHFLSHLSVLEGASFGPITNLGQPDRLIRIGRFSINLLPILMTSINCISSAVYLKGFSLKDKIQTYGMALIFLVLLYDSPSGLVVYWTCNNIFSLLKNIFYKLKHPKKVAVILCAVLGTLFSVILFASGILNSKKKEIAAMGLWIITIIPLIIFIITRKRKSQIRIPVVEKTYSKGNFDFILSGIFLTILLGLMIPSAVISSSPAEFVDLQNYRNPLLYLVNSSCYAAGFFLLWAGIIRYMMNEKFKPIMNLLFWIISGVFLINYMCFGHNLGIISPTLVYENDLMFTKTEKFINIISVIVTTLILFFIFRFKKLLPMVTLILIISTGVVSINQIHKTQILLNDMSYIKESKNSNSSSNQIFTLSKTGKNVIVFMLDRAISGFIPYIIEEKPEIKNQFSGFTYYPNVISYGAHTMFGAPPIFGGYEYTPKEINKNDSKLLKDKHNEALKLLPYLFLENGYDITICDPPLANYKWIPDLSIFDDYPEINCFLTKGMFSSEISKQAKLLVEKKLQRNFFCYSLFKSFPTILQPLLYDDGVYFYSDPEIPSTEFIDNYSVLQALPRITKISNTNQNTFISITNETTHNTQKLYPPEYTLFPSDNSTFNKIEHFNTKIQNEHYDINIASLIQIAKWLDFMKKNDVYDNTRIIIVSDHGWTNDIDASSLGCFENMIMKNIDIDISIVNPLLLIKDFNSKEFKIDNTFMTNADVPTIATNNLIKNPKNPFTGNPINSNIKLEQPQYITTSHNFQLEKNEDKTKFDTSDGHWYSVHDNIFDESNWTLLQ